MFEKLLDTRLNIFISLTHKNSTGVTPIAFD